jgi:CheY-like chemotaxis protein
MAIQTSSAQRSARALHSVHQYARSGQYSTSLHSYERRVRCAPLSVPIPATTGDPARILLVDDAQTTGPLEYLLHGLGYWTTRVAVSGEIALGMAHDFAPSVVLLALDLPDMSSYSLAMQLRDRAGRHALRLIAMTGDSAYPGRDLARRAGFERYLAKPVNSDALNQLLRSPQAW